jgi:AAA domain
MGINPAFKEIADELVAEDEALPDAPPSGWSLLSNHKITAPRTLIKGVLPYQGIAFIGGQSGAGKTFLAGHMAVCLGSASPFFGRTVHERVGVGILAAEGTESMGNRLTAAAKAVGLDIRKLPIAWRGSAPLKSEKDVEGFGEQLLELGRYLTAQYNVRFGVAILDTVAATFDMDDEDSNSEVAKAIKKMRHLSAKFNGLVVPIHHYGKTATTGLRGGSAWRAGADVVLSVLCDRNELTGEVSNRQLALAKARDGIEGPIAPFDLTFAELGKDGDEPFGTLIVQPSERPTKRASKSLTAEMKLALTALANCDSIKPPPDFPAADGILLVDIKRWRAELFSRGILDKDAANPRQDFKRLKDKLQVLNEIGVHDGYVWKATPS